MAECFVGGAAGLQVWDLGNVTASGAAQNVTSLVSAAGITPQVGDYVVAFKQALGILGPVAPSSIARKVEDYYDFSHNYHTGEWYVTAITTVRGATTYPTIYGEDDYILTVKYIRP